MKYKIKVEKRAVQELDKLDQIISRRLIKDIKELREGIEHKDVKRLKGSSLYRLRIGNYRVILEIIEDLIKVLKVGHRKNVYKRKAF